MYIVTHTKEKPNLTNQYFLCKIGQAMKSKEGARFELECLRLIFIYFNSKFRITCKNAGLNASTSGLVPKISHPKFVTLQRAFCRHIRKRSQTEWPSRVFWIYCSWWNHWIGFKMVYFYIEKAKSGFD